MARQRIITVCLWLLAVLSFFCTVAIAPLQGYSSQFSSSDAGNIVGALDYWRKAEKAARLMGKADEVVEARIKQSYYLKLLGRPVSACTLLSRDLHLKASEICVPGLSSFPKSFKQIRQKEVTASQLRNLAECIRLLNNWEVAQYFAQVAYEVAEKFNLPLQDYAFTLGNSYAAEVQSQLRRGLQSNNLLVRSKILDTTLPLYNQAIEWYKRSSSVSAQINSIDIQWQFSKLANKDNIIDIERQLGEIPSKLPTDGSYASILSGLKYVWVCLSVHSETTILEAKNYFSQLQKKEFTSPYIQTWILGTLGRILLEEEKYDQAFTYFSRAISTIQSMPDLNEPLVYWFSSIATVYEKKNQPDKAVIAYEKAVNLLDGIREEVLPLGVDSLSELSTLAESIYESYLELLVQSSAPNWNKVIEVTKSRAAEQLKNLLGCNFIEAKEEERLITTVNLVKTKSKIFEIIQLKNTQLFGFEVPTRKFEDAVENASSIFESSKLFEIPIGDIQIYMSELYELLIKPVEGYLEASERIQFNTSLLRNIPASLLFDGDKYLVEKHPILYVSISKKINQASPVSKALVFFVSEVAPSFSASLPPLKQGVLEAKAVQDSVPSKVYANRDFTKKSLEDALQSADAGLLHISSHGQFSSDPRQTKIYAWDEAISLPEIRFRLRRKAVNGSFVLLVLSACETAKGDQSSTLGLAGIAAETGVNSTLATLWSVEETSTARLMKLFYQYLKKSDGNASLALQYAQAQVMQEYPHPYYWAPFVLVSSE